MTRKLREKGQTARYTFEDIFCSTKDMQVIINKAKKIAKNRSHRPYHRRERYGKGDPCPGNT